MRSEVPRSVDEITTLAELARFNAMVRPDKDAFIFEGRTTTYGQFDELTNRVANRLLLEGLSAGRRVAVMDKNSDQFFQLVFGCAKSGNVIVGINWRLAPGEVAQIINDSKAEILFVGPEFFGLVEQIRREVPGIRHVVAMGPGHEYWQQFEFWRDQSPAIKPDVQVTSDDVAIQIYTSGTTGHPKGVQLAHRSFFSLLRYPPNEDMECKKWTEDDVSLVAMPNFHIGGVGWGIAGLRAGARNVVIREFDPGVTLKMIHEHAISKLFLVPTAMRLVLQHPLARKTNYDSLKYINYGASPIPLDLLREAIEVFRCGFVQLYGMTETTGEATYLPPEDHELAGNKRMKSAGKPLPGVRIKVVDDSGRELPPGVVGEICIDSPANMVGYWNMPEATAATFLGGYVRTGDAGCLDEDGYVYVSDRVKDVIISGGENIYPAEVEGALFGHPAVADVAVIGVPDERWGEAVKALIVKKSGQMVNSDELIGFARQRIAGYKLPKSVDFVDDLPRNPAGKVLKRELRERYRAAARQVDGAAG